MRGPVHLRIEHRTVYRYGRPVTFGRHRLVIRPREGHDLRVRTLDLQLAPASRVTWIRDVFGNSVALVDWLESAQILSIVSRVTLERVSAFPTSELHEPWRVPYPPHYDPLEAGIVGVYAAVSFPEDVPRLQSWLDADFTPDPDDAEGAVERLCALVHRTIDYRRRPERGTQTPAETLDHASGSCRDMATLLMDAARSLGIAARFVSGYLHGSASLAGRASTHAWTEVYLPTLGWRGFDPSTGAPVTPAHIVTGVSTHPRGVMPVSGVYTGTPGDYLGLEVTVTTEVLSTRAA